MSWENDTCGDRGFLHLVLPSASVLSSCVPYILCVSFSGSSFPSSSTMIYVPIFLLLLHFLHMYPAHPRDPCLPLLRLLPPPCTPPGPSISSAFHRSWPWSSCSASCLSLLLLCGSLPWLSCSACPCLLLLLAPSISVLSAF